MKIPKRIAQALLNSLKGGVVPRVGLPYIAVGRKEEIDALLHDVDIIAEGGASFRFLVGKYGSGKSFLLQTIRNYVMAKNFVVVDADLSPERRLQGTRGQGLATYKELIRNMSTKTKPEGGALSLILDRWISNVQQEVMASENLSVTSAQLPGLVEKRISAVIYSLNEMVHGFDFARLLTLYYQAYISGDDETKAKVLKWFRGEYGTKTEARQELGVHKNEAVRRSEVLEKFYHPVALVWRGQIAGINGVKVDTLSLPVTGNRGDLVRQIQTGKVRKHGVCGQYSCGQGHAFHPHGGDHRQGHGDGAAAQAGNVLQGYNSFHRQKPPFKRILHAVHNGNCQNRNEKQGQGKCRIEVLKIQKCAQEKNN